MEDTVGLGNHIRHDALTGASASASNGKQSAFDSSFQARPHATVFVSASTSAAEDTQSSAQDYDQEMSCRSNGGENIISVTVPSDNATTNGRSHFQEPQHSIPLFPAPPPHPSAATQTATSHLIEHQSLPHFPRPPPAPPNGMFPPPPDAAPTYPTNVHSTALVRPPHQPPSQIQQPLPPLLPPGFLLPQLPPPQLPPHFPPPPTRHRSIDPPPTVESITSITPTQGISSHASPHTLSTPQITIRSSSGQEGVRSFSLPDQPNSASLTLVDTTHQIAPFVAHSSQDEKQSQQYEDPIEKARAIARRFHIESTQRQSTGNHTLPFIPDSNVQSNKDDDIDYLKQRQAHFQIERMKLEKFRLKNLEYVIKHDEMELRRHVECMNQITAYEEKQNIQLQLAQQQQRQRQLKIEQREQQKVQMNMMNASGGGIGSRDQQRAERVRKREHLEQATSLIADSNGGSNREEKERTSLYLTNLPTDGSTTERILHSLFGSYGRLDRVTMYRNRNTGDLKGDGLIVFGKEAVEAYKQKGGERDLVEDVCLQMNGAELPCGTAIGVQPADMSYNKKSTSKDPPSHNDKNTVFGNEGDTKKPSTKGNDYTTEIEAEKDDAYSKDNVISPKESIGEDLDDFFASLV